MSKAKPDLKSQFLTEVVERYTHWMTVANSTTSMEEKTQAQEFAESYEHLMCLFTTPVPIKVTANKE